MSLLNKMKSKIADQSLEYLRDVAYNNFATEECLRKIYDDVAKVIYQVTNTTDLSQLLKDILAEDYASVGVESDDLETLLKEMLA